MEAGSCKRDGYKGKRMRCRLLLNFRHLKQDALISCYAPKAEYQKETTGTVESQLEMTKNWNCHMMI